MKKRSLAVLSSLVLTVVILAGVYATPTFADTLNKFASSVFITNNGSDNALSIVQSSDVGRGRADAGAIHLDNTGNRNTGLTLYTNRGSDAAQPLMRLEVDNESWSEEVLYIHSDSPTSRGLIRLDSPAPEIEFVETDQPGAKGKFEIRVQHNTLQWNARLPDDSGFEKRITMTQEGDLSLHTGGLTVHAKEPSVFAGGINITGGCLAVNGRCVDVGDISASQPASETSESPSTGSFAAETSAGAPRELDCNSYTERGRMVLDHENNRLYVCNGPDRGWDYTSLTN